MLAAEMQWRVLWILLAVLIQQSATTEKRISEEIWKTWINAILKDLKSIPLELPDVLFTFKAGALPIAMAYPKNHIVIAAAELGEGRVVAMSDNRYAKYMGLYDHGCKNLQDGTDYVGTLSTTKSGYTCQDWREQTPHSHQYTIDNFPNDKTMDDVANYCRNPTSKRQLPWCFTTDPLKEKEFCKVYECIKQSEANDLKVLQLQNNVVNWLSKGTYTPKSLCKMEKLEDVSCLDNGHAKVAVTTTFNHAYLVTPEANAKMLNWVRQGGGLFMPIAGSKFNTYHKAIYPWTLMPFYNVLVEVGIGIRMKSFADRSRGSLDLTADVGDRIIDMRKFSLPYVLDGISQIEELKKIETYMPFILDVIMSGDDITLSYGIRKSVAQHFVTFAHNQESNMIWPSCDPDNTVVMTETHIKHMLQLYTGLGFLGMWNRRKAPHVDKCPGDVPDASDVPRVSGVVTVNSHRKDFLPTGYYLVPGDEMTLTVLSTDDESWRKFTVIVGIHTDQLWHLPSLIRFPQVSYRVLLQEVTTTLHNPFGGLIVLYSPDDPANIKIRLSSVIKAPVYELGDEDSMNTWNENKLNPGLWADLRGKYVRFYLQTSKLQDFESEDVAKALTLWDHVVNTSWQLVGRPESDRRPITTVPDVQISAGSLHSGYPIMATEKEYSDPSDSWWPMNTHLFQAQWGMFHEIGHNLQKKDWTFEGFTEVTNNIISMMNMDDTGRFDPAAGSGNWLANKAYEDSVWLDIIMNKNYKLVTEAKGVWTTLVIYYQLYLQFGWGCLREVFQGYEYDREFNPKVLENKDNTARLNEWVTRLNKATEYNLCPLYELWSYPVDSACDNEKTLSPFLPLDVVTEKNEIQTRVTEIVDKYPNLLRNLPTKPACHTMTFYEREALQEEILKQADVLKSKVSGIKSHIRFESAGAAGKNVQLMEKIKVLSYIWSKGR